MKCSDCLFYIEKEDEKNDRCGHQQASAYTAGIRTDMVITHHKCVVMLASNCVKHRLFQPKLGVA